MPLSPEIAARMARELVTNYGREAEEVAAERAQALAQLGNREAARIWADVSEIVLQLRTPCPLVGTGSDRPLRRDRRPQQSHC